MSAWMSQARTHLPRFAETAVERARLTVVPRRRPQAPRVPFMILVSMVLLGGVVGLLLFNTSMQQASFAATALETRADQLKAREQGLQMQIDRLRDPQRVASRARELGMVPLVNPAFIDLADGSVLGNPAPATAEDGIRLDPLPSRKPAALDLPPLVLDPEPAEAPAQGRPARR